MCELKMRPSEHEHGDPTARENPGSREQNEKNPLQSATDFILRSTEAMRDCHVGRVRLFQAEDKALLCWGQKLGVILNQEIISDYRSVSSGAEHEVFFDEANQKAIKITRDGSYGHSVTAGPGRSALPREYLQRWLLQNSIFGDSAQLVGLIPGESFPRFVISQNWITAHPKNPLPEQSEIDAYFHELGFENYGDFGVPVYYSTDLDVVVLDASSNNIFRDEHGNLVAIDVVAGTPSPLTRQLVGLPTLTPP